MKQVYPIRLFLAFLLLGACMTPCVSAYIISSVTVTPPGFQPAGTPMTVISVINFPATGATTFPADSELQMSTDLVGPDWVPVVVVDGKETPLGIRAGGEMILPGKDLSYLPSQSVQLNVTVSGKIPSDRHPGQTIVKIQERDAAKKIVAGDDVAMPEVTLVPTTLPSAVADKTATANASASLPAATPKASPAWTGAAGIVLAGAALIVMKRK